MFVGWFVEQNRVIMCQPPIYLYVGPWQTCYSEALPVSSFLDPDFMSPLPVFKQEISFYPSTGSIQRVCGVLIRQWAFEILGGDILRRGRLAQPGREPAVMLSLRIYSLQCLLGGGLSQREDVL